MVGLEPQTLYAYWEGAGAVWSGWFHFRIASREAEPFTFVYVGDAQNDSSRTGSARFARPTARPGRSCWSTPAT